MRTKVYNAISTWAGTPTWHTGERLDEGRFKAAVSLVVLTVGLNVERCDFEGALREYAGEASGDLEASIQTYTDRAMSIIEGARDKERVTH